jgi:hypothetical protein
LALDILAKHPNTGPFIGRQLIQRFTMSHPSTAYVGRVAAIFNNNGRGVRGDLKATLRAVLLDPEARATPSGNASGRLREPLQRFVQWGRSFGITSTTGRWPIGDTSDPHVAVELARYGHRGVPGWKGSDFFCRRRAFERAGPFDSSLRHAAITKWLLQCDSLGIKRHLLAEPLVVRTLRPSSSSTRKHASGVSSSLNEYLNLAYVRLQAQRDRRSKEESS